MSATLTRSPVIQHTDLDWHPTRPECDPGPTLEDVVCRAWEVLGAELPAGCPVCGGELLPRQPAHGERLPRESAPGERMPRESAPGGRCQSCGSMLS